MSDLDEEQRAAVRAPERAIAVLAGPGSGKTRTLSARTQHLLQEDAASRSRALLLTFMNKAAAEMKARVLAGSSLATDRVDAGTFHAFGMRFLRDHGDLVGIQKDFEVLDPEDAEEIAIGIGGTSGDLRKLGNARRTLVPVSGALRKFALQYERVKREERVVDFDDLIVFTGNALVDVPGVAEAYGARFPQILVDEFQDTSPAQFKIVRALAPHAHSLSIFADDDQAIMRFAGADVGNIGLFMAGLGAAEYPLTVNYRCRERIVQVANALLDADATASSRRMGADREGGEVVARAFPELESESQWIAADVGAQLTNFRPWQIAILTPSGYRANQVVDALSGMRIPISDWRGDTHTDEGRQMLRASLGLLRPRIARRQEKRLCEMMGVPATIEHCVKNATLSAKKEAAPIG